MAKHYTKLIIAINENINSIVTAVKGDVASRFLDVQLYSNGTPIDLTSHTVTMSAKSHPDSNFKVPIDKFIDGVITDATNGRCQFELKTDILGQTGVLILQISIFSGQQEVLSTNLFNLYVIDGLRNDEQIEASNEFGALVVLFSEIQNALDDLHAITESFGTASEETTSEGIKSFWQMLENVRKDIGKAIIYDASEKIGNPDDEADVPSLFGRIKKLDNNLSGGEMKFETSGKHNYTFPKGIGLVEIIAAGAGGGGGAGLGGDRSGGGGGGGGDCVRMLLKDDEIPQGEISITVGKGGTGGKSENAPGTNGTATVVGDIVTVAGGFGATYEEPYHAVGGNPGGQGGGKGGGTNSEENDPHKAENGLYGKAGINPGAPEGGEGGGGSFGYGGNGGNSPSRNGTNGKNGGGGGGGYNYPFGNGGNGGDGIVIIRWGNYIGLEVPI